jgi:hypothetical protein
MSARVKQTIFRAIWLLFRVSYFSKSKGQTISIASLSRVTFHLLFLASLCNCSVLGYPNTYSPRAIPLEQLGQIPETATIIALETNGPIYFESFDSTKGMVPQWCADFAHFALGPSTSVGVSSSSLRSGSILPTRLLVFSLMPGAYIFSGYPIPPDVPFPASPKRSFTIAPGQRLFLGSFQTVSSGPPAFLPDLKAYSTGTLPSELVPFRFTLPTNIQTRSDKESNPPVCMFVL